MAWQKTHIRRLLPILFLVVFSALFSIGNIYAQNIVSVNNLTGTANVSIPVYNVTIGGLSSPVALTYSASGLKVSNYDNSYGQGWNLVAASSVTREVRGFPDDVEYQSEVSYSIIKEIGRAHV